jgi:serine/threonine protein phosphatase 1
MGYGPRIIDTINEILTFRRHVIAIPGVELTDVIFLRGAQEEMWQKLLQLQFAQGPRKVLTWMVEHGAGATISAYGGRLDEGMEAAEQGVLALTRWTNALRQSVREWDGHSALMSALRHAAVTDDGALLFVHAGVDPVRPLEAQLDQFWWGSSTLEGQAGPYQNFTALVRGNALNGPKLQTEGPILTLDGGCGRVNDGTLVAACLDGSAHVLDILQF